MRLFPAAFPVIAVGEDVDIGVAAGDRVLFSKYSSSGEPAAPAGRGSVEARQAATPLYGQSSAAAPGRAARRACSAAFYATRLLGALPALA